MTSAFIYFDHNATTPPHPQVIRAARAAMRGAWANPSSVHQEGRAARRVLDESREQVGYLIGANPDEIVFTSGGTEANNLAILGMAGVALAQGRVGQIVSSPLEHPSVREPVAALVHHGFRVTLLRPDSQGRLDPDELRRILHRDSAAFVTLALANHEIGNLYPIAEMAQICQEHEVPLHCDAVQAAGRVPIDVASLGVTLLTLTAHKLRGLRGAAALYVRGRSLEFSDRGLPLQGLLLGGGQEGGLRAGTEDVPAIAGFAEACRLAAQGMEARARKVTALRDRLERQLLELPRARLFGDGAPGARTPGTCTVGFTSIMGHELVRQLDRLGIAVSSGAACRSGRTEPSPVLLAMGYRSEEAATAVRFSLGTTNTAAEVDRVAAAVGDLVCRRR